jgi:hypothetical protein
MNIPLFLLCFEKCTLYFRYSLENITGKEFIMERIWILIIQEALNDFLEMNKGIRSHVENLVSIWLSCLPFQVSYILEWNGFCWSIRLT